MKTLLLISSAVLLVATYSSAQNTHPRREHEMQTGMQNHMHRHNYFMFEKGKLYHYSQGKKSPINKTMTFGSNLKVNPNGTYRYGNMKQMQLKEGECLDMQGHRYSNEEMMREHFRTDNVKHEKEKMNQENHAKKPSGKKQ